MNRRFLPTLLSNLPFGLALLPPLVLSRFLKSKTFAPIVVLVSKMYCRIFWKDCSSLIHFYHELSRVGVKTFSQNLQDIAVLKELRMQNGFFVDIGAAFAEKDSNTYLLQEYFSWSGVLVEPNPARHSELNSRLSSDVRLCRAGLSRKSGQASLLDRGGLSKLIETSKSAELSKSKRKQYKISLITVNELIDIYAISRIDYLSIDIEGSDYDVLSQFFDLKLLPRFITIEHNFDSRQVMKIESLAIQFGYEIIFRGWSAQDIWMKKIV
jgi:FkbM family methyltransferase